MSRAILEQANLRGVDLKKADLSRAHFAGADLTDASFNFANVARTHFTGAKLDGVNMKGAYTYLMRIEGTDLSNTQGLTQDQLDIACGDDATGLPAGLAAAPDWPCN